MEPIPPKKKKSKTTSTNLSNSNHTSAIPSKSNASGCDLSAANHSKEEKYADLSLTGVYAAYQGENPSMDDLSKEEKYANIPHTSAAEQAEMEKPSVMVLKEHSGVHVTTERYADLGSLDVEEKEQVFERSNNSEKHISTFLWRDDGIKLKAHMKRYSTRKHDFQSAEVDFLDSDNASDNEPDDTNA